MANMDVYNDIDPNNQVISEETLDHTTKHVDTIPESEEEELQEPDEEEQQSENIRKLERDLEAIKTKLDQIKIENMVFNEEMSKSNEYTSLTEEYDKKIMEYDKEFNAQQKLIEEEEILIEQYEKEFNEKLTKHNINLDDNMDNGFNNAETILRNAGKHVKKTSIVLYDNEFAINHQLQAEIDKLTQQIEWLQKSKIQLVKIT
eukprot:961499_1